MAWAFWRLLGRDSGVVFCYFLCGFELRFSFLKRSPLLLCYLTNGWRRKRLLLIFLRMFIPNVAQMTNLDLVLRSSFIDFNFLNDICYPTAYHKLSYKIIVQRTRSKNRCGSIFHNESHWTLLERLRRPDIWMVLFRANRNRLGVNHIYYYYLLFYFLITWLNSWKTRKTNRNIEQLI